MVMVFILVVTSFLVGAGSVFSVAVPHIDNTIQINEAIEKCQKDLPRDQYCTIIAVPDNEIEE